MYFLLRRVVEVIVLRTFKIFTELYGCPCIFPLVVTELGEYELGILYKQSCTENAMLVNKKKG